MSHPADPWSHSSASGASGLPASTTNPGQSPAHQPYGPRQPYGPSQQHHPYQPYGPNPYWAYGPQPHPQGTMVLILGILGFFTVGVTGLLAWIFGRKTLREIDANPLAYADRGQVQIGYVLGIVSAILNAAAILVYVGLLVFYLVMMLSVMTAIPR